MEEAAAHLRGIEAQGLQVLTFRAVESAVQRVAEEHPLVVVCEDLHWADVSSLELLEHLMPLTERVPLLLVCLLRPEREHGCWQVRETAARRYPHRHSDLWLEPLSQAESQELVRNLLRVEDLPEALRERILERAEGNPFYVEEILRALIDVGIVVHDAASGRWRATRAESSDSGDEIPIPDTLQGVLRARIDRLPEEPRRVLQMASVIGRIFSYRVLEAVVGGDSPSLPAPLPQGARGDTLDKHLLTLQREQMIREQARLPERQYAFKHYLTVEAAYGGILRRERRATHRRVAEALEQLYPERVEEQLGLLARHWEEGGERARAAGYLERAGAQAASQFANAEALVYLARALDLTDEGDLLGRYRLLLTREAVYHLQGTRSSQRADLEALRELARALDDGEREATRRRAEVALREAEYLKSAGDRASAAASIEEVIRLAQAAQDRSIEAAGHLLGGPVGGESRDARVARYERALTLARAAHDRVLEAESLRELGLESYGRGEYARAIPYHEQTLRLYREIGNRMGEGRALNGLGLTYLSLYDLARARSCSEQGLQLSRETGNRWDETHGLLQLGQVCIREGDHSRAIAHLEQAVRIVREIGAQGEEPQILLYMGLVYRLLGNYGRAWELFERVQRSPSRYSATPVWALVGKGSLLHDTGDDAQARECCERALSMIGAGDRITRAWFLIPLGHALAGLGHLAEAQEAYCESQSLARDLGRDHLSIAPLSGLAHVALAGGRPVQALALLPRAARQRGPARAGGPGPGLSPAA
jgi:tetratricopeptide (TPR) repeat protein